MNLLQLWVSLGQKSTLLNLIASFDGLTEGDIIVDGAHLNNMKNKSKALYRQQMVGFVFKILIFTNNDE